MKLIKLPFILIFLFITIFAQAQVSINIDTSHYKIALSFDGNAHDADDIVAAPMTMAIIAEAGLKDKVVHVDYSNHIWDDNGSNNDTIKDQVTGMREAIQGTINHWNYDSSIFFEARISSELMAAKSNFANKVTEAFDAGEQLYYLLGGPMEVPYQCITEVPDSLRSYITAVSHSYWNEEHAHDSARTWIQLKETGVKTVRIADQNTSACKGCSDDNDLSTTQFDRWQWLADLGGKFKWLYDQNPFTTKFDASDAGMAWWVITGRPGIDNASDHFDVRYIVNKDIYATTDKIEALFLQAMNGDGGSNEDSIHYASIPGQLEAEGYSNQSGVQDELTSDTGEGQNIGYIENGDWVEYNVEVEVSGNYEVVFRVASAKKGGKIEIVNDNAVLSSVDVPGTGNWQEWTNVTTTVQLTQGKQTLRLNFVGIRGYLFNINWINFTPIIESPIPLPDSIEYFFIVNKKTGKKICPLNDSDSARIVQAPADWEDDIVQWEQIFTEGGYFYLKNKATGKYFRPDNGNDFSPILQMPTSYDGRWTQWKKVDTNDGYFHLENQATDKRIRATSTDDLASGTEYFIEQTPKSWTGDWVRWNFVPVNEGARLAGTQERNSSYGNENLSLVEEIPGESMDISVYPNPTAAYLNISGITPDTQMKIFDLKGNVLMGVSGKNNINVSMLPAGMYLLSIDGKTMQRFIKE